MTANFDESSNSKPFTFFFISFKICNPKSMFLFCFFSSSLRIFSSPRIFYPARVKKLISFSSYECYSIPSLSSPSFTSLQPINGSYLKASTIVIIDYLLFLNNFIILLQVCLKIPWTPQGYMALTSILVSLNGTFSGNYFLILVTSKQSPKSIWTIWPVSRCIMILFGCLSPSPMMYPTMDITAKERTKQDLDLSHS